MWPTSGWNMKHLNLTYAVILAIGVVLIIGGSFLSVLTGVIVIGYGTAWNVRHKKGSWFSVAIAVVASLTLVGVIVMFMIKRKDAAKVKQTVGGIQ